MSVADRRPKVLVVVALPLRLKDTDIKDEKKLPTKKIIQYLRTACRQQEVRARILQVRNYQIEIVITFQENPIQTDYIPAIIAEFQEEHEQFPEEVILFYLEVITPDREKLAQIFHQSTYEEVSRMMNLPEEVFQSTVWMKIHCRDEKNISPMEIWKNEKNEYFLIN